MSQYAQSQYNKASDQSRSVRIDMETRRRGPLSVGDNRDGRATSESASDRLGYVETSSPLVDGIPGSEDSDMKKQQERHLEPCIREDRGNIALLMFLYILQGVPLGLAASIPLILIQKGASYKQQAEFSFVYWPFSIKLLWAPIVDSLFLPSMGRRKTWLIPTQYLLGVSMLFLSFSVEELLQGPDGRGSPQVGILTMAFFFLNFLAATQDIAVDGWALTMLKRRNVGYASTCNSVGQTTGYFLGYVLLMALESTEFCNTYLRSEPSSKGLVTLAGFLYFWGWVFLGTTTLVWIMKAEKAARDPHSPTHSWEEAEGHTDEGHHDLDIMETYHLLWKIIRLPAVKTTVIFLLTTKMGFAAADSVTGLKLVEAGVPRDRLALMAVPLIPFQIILPLVVSRYTNGPEPMKLYIWGMPKRLLFGLGFAVLVWVTPSFNQGEGHFPLYYYAGILVIYAAHQVFLYSMFVSAMALFARVSDPLVGGTYMTLLNTVFNLGGNWCSTLMLWMVDSLTWRECRRRSEGTDADADSVVNLSCSGKKDDTDCVRGGGSCVVTLDGYYIESILCVIVGVVWFYGWGKQTAHRMQSLPLSAWKVKKNQKR